MNSIPPGLVNHKTITKAPNKTRIQFNGFSSLPIPLFHQVKKKKEFQTKFN